MIGGRGSAGEPLVLCYHAVSERWPAPLAIAPARLDRQLTRLLERGYRGVTFHQAVHEPPEGRVLAVTFDDGYRSVVRQALPIMRRLGLPGTVFVVTDYLARAGPMSWSGIDQWVGGPHEPELEPLSLADLGTLQDAGWEIGSHTRSHPRLTAIGTAALRGELQGSREECELRLGAPCRSLAYPYGDVDDRVVRAAGDAGYLAAAMLPGRFQRPTPLAWPRIGIYRSDSDRRVAAKVSPTVRRLRGLRAWELADRARSIRIGRRQGGSR